MGESSWGFLKIQTFSKKLLLHFNFSAKFRSPKSLDDFWGTTFLGFVQHFMIPLKRIGFTFSHSLIFLSYLAKKESLVFLFVLTNFTGYGEKQDKTVNFPLRFADNEIPGILGPKFQSEENLHFRSLADQNLDQLG